MADDDLSTVRHGTQEIESYDCRPLVTEVNSSLVFCLTWAANPKIWAIVFLLNYSVSSTISIYMLLLFFLFYYTTFHILFLPL